MARFLLFVSAFVLLASCSKKINQYVTQDKIKVRDGRWVEKDKDELGEYISKGKYKLGNKIGTWKTTYQGKRYHREKFKGNTSWIIFYHPNGKKMEEGASKVEHTSTYVNWYYDGLWKYYNEDGSLRTTKVFDFKKADSTIVDKPYIRK